MLAPGTESKFPGAQALGNTPAPAEAFRVSLDVFEGPFDVLLRLISKHELDITAISLSLVTDEFIAYVAELNESGPSALDRVSEFLVVATTLLDLKIASLLPQGEVVDAEELALFEARDLLFARLLQYRAFKQASSWFRVHSARESARIAREVALDEQYRADVPELVWNVSLQDFAVLAELALTPQALPSVGLDHLHAPAVSLREQAALVVALLRSGGTWSFRDVVVDVTARGVVVARFLVLLELYRRDTIRFHQDEPLGELLLTWEATDWSDADLVSLGGDYG